MVYRLCIKTRAPAFPSGEGGPLAVDEENKVLSFKQKTDSVLSVFLIFPVFFALLLFVFPHRAVTLGLLKRFQF